MTRKICQRFVVVLLALLQTLSWAQIPEDTARIHYQRPDGVYENWELHVWEDTTESVTWADGLKIAGFDDYGAYWDVGLKENAQRVGFIVHKGDEKDPGPDMFLVLGQHGNEIWLKSGSDQIFSSRPLEAPAENQARVHYFRPDGDYAGFELHVWEDADEQVTWTKGLEIAGITDYGVYWEIRLKDDAERVGFIVHRGDDKDPGPDMFLVLQEHGNEIWLLSGSATIYSEQPDIRTVASGDLRKSQAHWLAPDLIAWDVGTVLPGTDFYLHASASAGLELTESSVSGGVTVQLTLDEAGLNEELQSRHPHLAHTSVLRLAGADAERAAELLQGQLAVSMVVLNETLLDATGLQIPGVLDALYADAARKEPLGLSWQDDRPHFAVWAPTAQAVRFHLFETPGSAATMMLDMDYSPETGIWTVSGKPDWYGQYYLYEVTVYAPSTARIETNLVTDPYSLSLSMNSSHSHIVNLDDANLKPAGWGSLRKTGIAEPEDITIYELHMRDFSVADERVPDDLKGTYKAFGLSDSYGVRHLRALAEAGLTHLHLLPTFDIATINEDKSTWQDPGDLDQFPPDSSEQQAAINAIRDEDAFNWGYDPFHFNVPEGSYATNPEGAGRILEFREMVVALADMGLHLVIDVVYNHSNASGQSDKSVFDRIVPGYYHRLNKDGFVETSTCCQNIASEHAMMEQFMIDSVLLWAKHYKVDAFRFDLMGHHMRSNMLAVREALDTLTLGQDGVNGQNIFIYGEGWNFGEVANNARGINATQFNMAGTGIGTFNDRLRDAVRGGGPFDNGLELLSRQGFITGLGVLPNNVLRIAPAGLTADAAHNADLVRIGLAGNLEKYCFESAADELRCGFELDYNGSPAGYTKDPQENIVYVSKHDNQTLWDIMKYKLPANLTTAERARLQVVALSTVALAQGVPFFHAGSDLLRSKSLDRNSYNSGDWFNRLDFSYQHNNWGVGLPMAEDNRSNWQHMRPLLANPDLGVSPEDIVATATAFQTLLQIRYSSPLFRLRTAEDIGARLSFHNTGSEQLPGLIIMRLRDDVTGLPALDPEFHEIVVVFNVSNRRQTVHLNEFEGSNLRLHALLREGHDPLVKTATFYQFNSSFSVPAFTTAVFVSPR